MNYYISDLHLGHANVIRFDNRPFENIDEMEDDLDDDDIDELSIVTDEDLEEE